METTELELQALDSEKAPAWVACRAVRPISHRTDSAEILQAAAVARNAHIAPPADLADLLDAIGHALASADDIPLSDTERRRWTAVLIRARRVARTWNP